MIKHFFFCLFFLCSYLLHAQQWVDTLFAIQTNSDVAYGSAFDFAGNLRELKMDISQPIGDTPPECGRPLMLLVHGGAFIAGDKGDGAVNRMRIDFAKRGYTTASVNYRLGQFQTERFINCNVSALGVEWNCLNMSDTSEWYRAYYRAIQDVHGAIRFLVNHAGDYGIDPQHIFVAGESAGAFIAMGVGFIDDQSEVLPGLTGSYPNVQAPNSLYEMACVQGYGLDTSISSMDLQRPDLGGYTGTLNQPAATSYRIRGVGNFFGAVFNNIFASSAAEIPALYSFHQPNDLIVPYGKNKVFAGFNLCANQWPFSCQNIINRPVIQGSQAIKTLIDDMLASQIPAPDLLFDPSTNMANCAQQIANPGLGGHAIDNYWLRTGSMAAFFAGKIDSCSAMGLANQLPQKPLFSLSPNPVSAEEIIHIRGDFQQQDKIRLVDMTGATVFEKILMNRGEEVEIKLSELNFVPGLYLVQIQQGAWLETQKVLVRR